jgi:hypothetical protein
MDYEQLHKDTLDISIAKDMAIDDLVRRNAELRDELTAARAVVDELNGSETYLMDLLEAVEYERDAYRDALNEVAAWYDGPEVNGGFDEPASAAVARETLSQYTPKEEE